MKRCKACGAEYRKGRTAMLFGDDGAAMARVCQACAAGGLLVVAIKRPPVIKQERARTDEDVARVLRMLRTYRQAAPPGLGDRAEGLDTAIATIQAELTGERS